MTSALASRATPRHAYRSGFSIVCTGEQSSQSARQPAIHASEKHAQGCTCSSSLGLKGMGTSASAPSPPPLCSAAQQTPRRPASCRWSSFGRSLKSARAARTRRAHACDCIRRSSLEEHRGATRRAIQWSSAIGSPTSGMHRWSSNNLGRGARSTARTVMAYKAGIGFYLHVYAAAAAQTVLGASHAMDGRFCANDCSPASERRGAAL
eukprot:366496-Chlamydomonas_euryale.AAC.28